MDRAKENHDKIVTWIKDWFADKKGPVVIGISGGKDSTVCAALLTEALGKERVIGVMMPNGEQADISDSKKVIDTLGIRSIEINIKGMYNDLVSRIGDWYEGDEIPKLFTTNTPARLRMTTLYGIAAIYSGFVCNTCNRSEDYVGYSTKYGDAAGDFTLLNGLTKTEVVELGDYMKLPSELVHKAPSDGMCGKTDEDNMGFTYDTLDEYLLTGLRPKSLEVWNKICTMHNNPNTKLKLISMPGPFENHDFE
jgi:NAD+ synthase